MSNLINAAITEVLSENRKLIEALNKSRETIFEVRQQIQALRRTMREEARKTNTVEWIEVEKQLPDDGEAVLIAQQHGEVWLGFLDGDVWRLVSGHRVEEHEEVTHWMGIPAHPVEVGK